MEALNFHEAYLIDASYQGEYVRSLIAIDTEGFRLFRLQLRVRSTTKISFDERLLFRIEMGDGSKYRILDRLFYEGLTPNLQNRLFAIFQEIIRDQETLFLNFLNHGGAISRRASVFTDLRGVGDLRARRILVERANEPFRSFDDFENRTQITEIVTLIAERLVYETHENVTHRIFVRS